MLKIDFPSIELFDDANNEFISIEGRTLILEHSLVSISKWESRWKKPWLSRTPKTLEEEYDYIRCMTITKNVDPHLYDHIPRQIMKQINDYIDDPMTATTISKTKPSSGIITSEVIYGQMIALNIPVSMEKWHLNRLLTLIGVCDRNNSPPKKMTAKEIMAQNRRLNAERKKRLHSKG